MLLNHNESHLALKNLCSFYFKMQDKNVECSYNHKEQVLFTSVNG